jgi:dihydroxyacetone kinase-like protein
MLLQEDGMSVTTEHVLHWLQQVTLILRENRDFLTQLDAAIGDADHGTNMDRGFQAVSGKLATMNDADIGTILKTVGSTLVSTVGGASGPLYGTAFLRAGIATTGRRELSEEGLVMMLKAFVEGVKARGKAQLGEKTMLDALIPALEAAQDALTERQNLSEVLRRSSEAAEEGVKKTIPLLATKGRASYLGERSIGHQDPGATSSWLIIKALDDSI